MFYLGSLEADTNANSVSSPMYLANNTVVEWLFNFYLPL